MQLSLGHVLHEAGLPEQAGGFFRLVLPRMPCKTATRLGTFVADQPTTALASQLRHVKGAGLLVKPEALRIWLQCHPTAAAEALAEDAPWLLMLLAVYMPALYPSALTYPAATCLEARARHVLTVANRAEIQRRIDAEARIAATSDLNDPVIWNALRMLHGYDMARLYRLVHRGRLLLQQEEQDGMSINM